MTLRETTDKKNNGRRWQSGWRCTRLWRTAIVEERDTLRGVRGVTSCELWATWQRRDRGATRWNNAIGVLRGGMSVRRAHLFTRELPRCDATTNIVWQSARSRHSAADSWCLKSIWLRVAKFYRFPHPWRSRRLTGPKTSTRWTSSVRDGFETYRRSCRRYLRFAQTLPDQNKIDYCLYFYWSMSIWVIKNANKSRSSDKDASERKTTK